MDETAAEMTMMLGGKNPRAKQAVLIACLGLCSSASLRAQAGKLSPCQAPMLTGADMQDLRSAVALALDDKSLADKSSSTDASLLFGTIQISPKVRSLLVYINGQDYCGSGGCVALVLDKEAGRQGYHLVTKMTSAQIPIVALKTSHNGRSDIGVTVYGGGLPHKEMRALRFDGRSFPTNPTTVRAVAKSQSIKSVILGGSAPRTTSCLLP